MPLKKICLISIFSRLAGRGSYDFSRYRLSALYNTSPTVPSRAWESYWKFPLSEQSEVELATSHTHPHWSDKVLPYQFEVYPVLLTVSHAQATGDKSISNSVTFCLTPHYAYSCGSFEQEGKKTLSLSTFFTQSVLYECVYVLHRPLTIYVSANQNSQSEYIYSVAASWLLLLFGKSEKLGREH